MNITTQSGSLSGVVTTLMTDTKYINKNNSCLEVVVKGETAYVVSDFFNIKNLPIYDTKEEAMCYKMLKEVQNGKNISNFKASKYYNTYISFLKENYPEHLI